MSPDARQPARSMTRSCHGCAAISPGDLAGARCRSVPHRRLDLAAVELAGEPVPPARRLLQVPGSAALLGADYQKPGDVTVAVLAELSDDHAMAELGRGIGAEADAC